MGKLTNKVTVITGGTSGIGLATAELFIEEGATVIVTGRNPDTLKQAKAILGSGADVIAADTGDLGDVEQLFSTIKDRYKKIDALFVNAGIAKFVPFEQSTPELFDELRGGGFIERDADAVGIAGGGGDAAEVDAGSDGALVEDIGFDR